ncbi:NAD dependent epimerase/dehydratase family protein [Cordyceps militaris CM01]|uniref:NAD dependent epimerase/dehydratase family protein n=1 Tax=Cordyceps militaris (strain CM01) TaxID=983644 RepID=G3J9F7_CORMM|nr:NAD dependent epimerase/dehydratase family protein [Cordyceps militaris CM01]EGX94934.1 NAD dependent epimerase/dehydratase family protein [Cordyceps militaris CM01]
MVDRTVVVTGATGLLGRQVSRAFRRKGWNVKGTGLSRADGVDVLKVDLGNASEIDKLLEETNPEVIVHCAAERFPDKVEKDPEGARKLNVSATSSLAQAAAAKGAFLIYISTDYVFPGRLGEAPYEADSETSPPNLYGQTKLDGEKAALMADGGKPGSAVVLRVPVLYGSAETPAESAVNVLLDSVWKSQTEDKRFKMDHWAPRYPTNTEDAARVCHDIAEHYLGAADRASLPKILQFSSEDRMTKYEMCQKFAEIMGLPADNIEPNTEGNDPNAAVQRPYDTHLSTKTLKSLDIDLSTCDFTAWWRRELGAFRK